MAHPLPGRSRTIGDIRAAGHQRTAARDSSGAPCLKEALESEPAPKLPAHRIGGQPARMRRARLTPRISEYSPGFLVGKSGSALSTSCQVEPQRKSLYRFSCASRSPNYKARFVHLRSACNTALSQSQVNILQLIYILEKFSVGKAVSSNLEPIPARCGTLAPLRFRPGILRRPVSARAIASPATFSDLFPRGLAMVIINLRINTGETGNIG